jgi:hypothetical protein
MSMAAKQNDVLKSFRHHNNLITNSSNLVRTEQTPMGHEIHGRAAPSDANVKIDFL